MRIEQWLMTTVPGIILLGALGSLAAVLLGKLYLLTVNQILPAPLRIHRRRKLKQAFYLGYLSAHIEQDKTGRTLTTFLFYRGCRLAIALTAALFFVMVVAVGLLLQSQIVLTVTIFIGTTCAFLAAYWSYHEFEFIYRSYLFHWKEVLAGADKAYEQRPKRAENTTTEKSESRKPPNVPY